MMSHEDVDDVDNDKEEKEVDVSALLTLRRALRDWDAAHARGLTHLVKIPDLLSAAGLHTPPPPPPPPLTSEVNSAVATAVRAAPSPRLAAFIDAGWRHASVVAGAPHALTDAMDHVVAAARACGEAAAAVVDAADALGAACSRATHHGGECDGDDDGDGRHWIARVSGDVLGADVTVGPVTRSLEQWAWLSAAVSDCVEREVTLCSSPMT